MATQNRSVYVVHDQIDNSVETRDNSVFHFRWNQTDRKFVFVFARPRLGFEDLVQIDREINWTLNHPKLMACRVVTPVLSCWSTLSKWDVIFDCSFMRHVDSEFIPIHIAGVALKLRAAGSFVFLSGLAQREAFVKALGTRLFTEFEMDDVAPSIATTPFPDADDTTALPNPPIEGP